MCIYNCLITAVTSCIMCNAIFFSRKEFFFLRDDCFNQQFNNVHKKYRYSVKFTEIQSGGKPLVGNRPRVQSLNIESSGFNGYNIGTTWKQEREKKENKLATSSLKNWHSFYYFEVSLAAFCTILWEIPYSMSSNQQAFSINKTILLTSIFFVMVFRNRLYILYCNNVITF